MAYTFFEDRFMNNPYDFEDPEERRKRLEKEQQRISETEVGKTEVTQYADGSQTRTTTQELPPQGGFMRPVAPISPDNLLQRVRQVESGNRDYYANGMPVTSSAGAMFASQVMPSTARQPGYGIRPAQSQTPQEYNRVGQEFLEAMRKKYGNDELAVAAYNAGPGRVDQILKQAQQQGVDYRTLLPRETQQYLPRVMGARPQQAQQAQPQQAQPVRQAFTNMLNLAGISAGGEGTEGELQAQQRLQSFTNKFVQNQDNPQNLLALREDPTTPENIKQMASERAFELLKDQRNLQKATAEAQKLQQSGDSVAIGKVITSQPTDEEGSWLKLAVLGFVSPEAARMEASKLGLVPSKYQSSVIQNDDGTQTSVQLKVRADGKVTGGIDMFGKTLTPQQLDKAIGGLGLKDVQTEAGTYMDPTGTVKGNFVLERKPGGSQFREIGTNKIATPEQAQALRKVGVGGTLADQRQRQVQEINLRLQGKGAEEAAAILRNYNQQLVGQGFAPIQPNELSIRMGQIGGAQPAQAPAQGAVAPVAPGQVARPPVQAPVAPGQQPTVAAQPVTGARPTASQMAAAAEAQKVEAKEVAEDVAKAKVNVGRNRDNADYLLTKMNELVTHPGFSVSVGASVQPGFQFIPGTDKADWYARFEEIKGQQFLQAFESLKGGGAISEKEGIKAQAAISRMNTSQSEKEFKQAADDFMDIIKRGVDRQMKKAGEQPVYGTEAASRKKLSPEDKKALEWAEKNPNDPRSAQVRERLGL